MITQFKITNPTKHELDELINLQRNAKLSYSKNNLTGFDLDKNQIFLGVGEEVWQAAKTAIAQWAMFPSGWIRVYYQNPIFTEGAIVVVCAKAFGLWWLNASRILTVLDTDQHFGFAYGTLPNHIESGEELFQVIRNERGEVYYSISAFSRPRFWALRLTYPLSRFFQKRFIKESLNNMKEKTHEQLKKKYKSLDS